MFRVAAFSRLCRPGKNTHWILVAWFPILGCWAGEDESLSSAGTATDGWSLSKDPVVAIGVVEGQAEYELFQVSDALRLSDGRTVVVNTGTNELRYYAPDGTWIRSSGGTGEGPGEFERLTSASAIRGDTVMAWDTPLRRVTVFDPGGEVADDFVIRLPGETVQLAGYTGQSYAGDVVTRKDGVVLVVAQAPRWLLRGRRTTSDGFGAQFPDSTPPDGVYRFEHPLYVVDRDGQVEAVVSDVVSGEEFMVINGVERRIRFGHGLYITGGRERFVLGSGKPFSFMTLDAKGLFKEESLAIAERPLTAEIWDAEVERVVRFFDTWTQGSEYYEQMSRPPTLPSYSVLLSDELDRVWIGGFLTHDEEDSGVLRRWYVISPHGEPVAALTMPSELRVTDVSYGHVTGVVEDELGVSRVLVYRVAVLEKD